MALRTEDPDVWSIERCEKRNNSTHERMYRGWVRTIRYMCEKDWDWPIIVTGLEGTGKSAFAVNLACDLDEGVEKDLDKHIIWDLDDRFIEKIVKTEPSAFVLDEAGVDLFSRDFMKEKTKEIIRLVIIMRQFNHVPIIVLPKMKWLDSYLRDHRVQNWADIGVFGGSLFRERGKATVYLSEHHPMGSAPYWNELFKVRFANFSPTVINRYKELKSIYTEERFISTTKVVLSSKEEDMLNAKERGMTYAEIGRYYGVSDVAARKSILASMEKESVRRLAELKEAKDRGRTTSDIAKFYGVSKEAARQWLLKLDGQEAEA